MYAHANFAELQNIYNPWCNYLNDSLYCPVLAIIYRDNIHNQCVRKVYYYLIGFSVHSQILRFVEDTFPYIQPVSSPNYSIACTCQQQHTRTVMDS